MLSFTAGIGISVACYSFNLLEKVEAGFVNNELSVYTVS